MQNHLQFHQAHSHINTHLLNTHTTTTTTMTSSNKGSTTTTDCEAQFMDFASVYAHDPFALGAPLPAPHDLPAWAHFFDTVKIDVCDADIPPAWDLIAPSGSLDYHPELLAPPDSVADDADSDISALTSEEQAPPIQEAASPRVKRKYNRQKPTRADYTSEAEYQHAHHAWRQHRERNNKAVRKSRSLSVSRGKD